MRRNPIVPCFTDLRTLQTLRAQRLTIAALLLLASAPLILAQGSSSSSSTPATQHEREESTSTPRILQPEASGSAVTLETSEILFDLSVALNTCGYDADLSASTPIREQVRRQVATAANSTPEATKSRDALCTYVKQHTLADPGLNIAQYISLALYSTPELTPAADLTEMPPDSTQVAGILPLLKTFVEETHLHTIWIANRPAYNALVERIHDPLTKMILDTNIYLHSPVSSYDGRRFLVLLEPMLAPSAVNARIYGSNYIIVVSPAASGSFHLEQVRHTYLHYEVEPMVYARASAMDRLLPLLKTVQEAPIDFTHRSDIVALITECLIKAIEARTMETGIVQPVKPAGMRERIDFEKYDAAKNSFDRQTEAARRNAADQATHHGWVLTNYFYEQLIAEERQGISLKENIGQMVYGMDVDRQRRIARQVTFTPDAAAEPVRRVALPPTGLRLAEKRLVEGDAPGAEELANKALADPAADHAQANYILARIALLQRRPEQAESHFVAALSDAHDPHTLAWSHIYLGRLYDVRAERKKAVGEYQAALAVNDGQSETRTAASTGLRTPFALPKQQAPVKDAEEDVVDPTGKAEKDAYRPPSPK